MNLITSDLKQYQLIDSGDGEKLERFGAHTLRRPDPEALWRKMKSDDMWESADAVFNQQQAKGVWKKNTIPPEWEVDFGITKLVVGIGNNKHVGVFPEHVAQWKWMSDLVSERKKIEKKVSVLNLFGYTGGASCVLARAGGDVTHVDASKPSLVRAQNNKKSAGLVDVPIRFMLDDVRKFVEREIKRGVFYDMILLDPPVYGKGVDKKQWHIEEDLLPLLERLVKLLSKKPLAVVLSGYASVYSPSAYHNVLSGVFDTALVESGELLIQESDTTRLLPAGIFARAVF
jgi:23S rRNA (cytosine1962-C5)-methyltransferase